MTNFLFSKKEQNFHLVIESISKLCARRPYSANEKLNKRDKERLASNCLVDILMPNTSLSRNSYGAPLLSNAKAVSLSHSHDFLAIITANNTAAVDIQIINDKAFKVQSKFLHIDEFHLINNPKDATVLWCAKECLYKIHQKGNLIFSKDLRVHKLNSFQIECSILEKFYCLNYEIFDGLCVVYYFD